MSSGVERRPYTPPGARLLAVAPGRPVNRQFDIGTPGNALGVPASEADRQDAREVRERLVSRPVGHVCETCGKICATALGLAGHKRSHKG